MSTYVKANYCCGSGNWITVRDGKIVESGMDVFTDDSACDIHGNGGVVEDWCGAFYNLHPLTIERLQEKYGGAWQPVPRLPDGDFRLEEDGTWIHTGGVK